MPTVRQVQQPGVRAQPLKVALDRNVQSNPTRLVQSGLHGLSGDLDAAAQSFENINRRVDEAKIIQAETDYYRRADDLLFNGDNAYYKKKGEAAFTGVKDVNTELTKLREEVLAGLANQRQKNAFTKIADSRSLMNNRQISQHAERELSIWDKQASEARIGQAFESARLNPSDENISANLTRVRDEVASLADKNGMGADAKRLMLEENTSALIRDAVLNASDEDVHVAEAMLKKYGDKLREGDEDIIHKRIDGALGAEKAESIAAQVAAEGGSRMQRRRRAAELAGDDLAVKKMAQAQVASDFAQIRTARNEAQSDAYDSVQQMIFDGRSLPAITQTAQWRTMKPSHKNAIINAIEGKEVKTDIFVYDEIRTELNKATPEGLRNARNIYLENRDKLSRTDQKTFSNETTKQISQVKDDSYYKRTQIVDAFAKGIKDETNKIEFKIQMDEYIASHPDADDRAVQAEGERMLESTSTGLFSSEPAFIAEPRQTEKALDTAMDAYADVFQKQPSTKAAGILSEQLDIFKQARGRYPKKSELKRLLEVEKARTTFRPITPASVTTESIEP